VHNCTRRLVEAPVAGAGMGSVLGQVLNKERAIASLSPGRGAARLGAAIANGWVHPAGGPAIIRRRLGR